METKSKSTQKELAAKLVNCKMNCRRDYNPTRILGLLGPNENDIVSLRNYFIEEKEKLDKKGPYEFSQWFDKDVVKILDELIDSVDSPVAGEGSKNETIGYIIVKALKEDSLFRRFEWDNYHFLVKEGLFTLFSEFDSDFRGNIVACHKVGGKYIVIETERHPFDYDKQRYKTNEPKNKQFYSTEIRGEQLRLTSMVFNTFEAALFHTMAPSQYSAMEILFEAANKK